MKPRLSRSVRYLLDRVARHNEPLAGDLTEELALGRSQWWLRRQLLSAFFRNSFGRPGGIRLGLAFDPEIRGKDRDRAEDGGDSDHRYGLAPHN